MISAINAGPVAERLRKLEAQPRGWCSAAFLSSSAADMLAFAAATVARVEAMIVSNRVNMHCVEYTSELSDSIDSRRAGALQLIPMDRQRESLLWVPSPRRRFSQV